jgi:hypothetical protein
VQVIDPENRRNATAPYSVPLSTRKMSFGDALVADCFFLPLISELGI